MVSPGKGTWSALATRSRLMLPTTTIGFRMPGDASSPAAKATTNQSRAVIVRINFVNGDTCLRPYGVIIFCGVSHNFARVAEWHTPGDLKSVLKLLQPSALKRSTAKSPLFAVLLRIRLTHGRARRRTKLQTQPTPLPTPVKERKSAIVGFTEQVERVLRNGCATNGQPLSVHFFQSTYSGQCIIHLLPLFSRNKGIVRTRLNCILGYLQANLE